MSGRRWARLTPVARSISTHSRGGMGLRPVCNWWMNWRDTPMASARLVGPPATFRALSNAFMLDRVKYCFGRRQVLPAHHGNSDNRPMPAPASALAAKLRYALAQSDVSQQSIATECGIVYWLS